MIQRPDPAPGSTTPKGLRHTSATVRAALLAMLALLAVPTMQGCAIAQLVGGMAESYQATGSRTVYAEYEGLRDESYAIYVVAPRSIIGEYAGIDLALTDRITTLLRANNEGLVEAASFIPSDVVNRERYANPRMSTWPFSQVAEHFGVSRLIVVDISEMRLNEPGNRHVWSGVLAARVMVLEYQKGMAEDFAFTKDIAVRFPDNAGFTPADISAATIRAALVQRMSDRVAWLFYEHSEPNRITY